MGRILLILVFILCFISANSQDSGTKSKHVFYRKQMNIVTKKQVNDLKNGALLVRLKTKKSTIDVLRKNGRIKEADEIEAKQAIFNKNIICAFKYKFDFCPTYFFFSDYSNFVKDKQFDKVKFLSGDLQVDTAIKFTYKTFLTADFGPIEQDTVRYADGYNLVADQDWSVKKVTKNYSGPNFGFDALIIRSDIFIQLRDPFPYFQRTREPMPSNKKLRKTVETINNRFYWFYFKRNK
jgi:hypothetical protein